MPTPPVPVRPRRRGLWLTIAGLTAVVLAAPIGLQLYGLLIEQESRTVWSASHPITAVDLAAADGSVTVVPGAAGQVTLTQTLSWDTGKPTVLTSWRGDTLVVSVSCAPSTLFSTHDCGVELVLRVPAATAVGAKTQSGSIAVQGITGPLHLEAGSGEIQAVGTSGTLWARAESGAITGSGLLAASVSASTLSGQLNLQFAAPPVNVSASAASGNTMIVLPPGSEYRVTGQSASGQRSIDPSLLGDDSTRTVAVNSLSGNVLVQAQGG